MGNTIITSVCHRRAQDELEEVSDEMLAFMSVSMCADQRRGVPTKRASGVTKSTPMLMTFVPAVLIDQDNLIGQESAASRLYGHTCDDCHEMSFNDRLNMLTWDPECMPCYSQQHQKRRLSEFQELRPRATSSATTTPTATDQQDSKKPSTPAPMATIEAAPVANGDSKTPTTPTTPTTTAAITPTTSARPISKKRTLKMTQWGQRQAIENAAAVRAYVPWHFVTTRDKLHRDEDEESLSETESEGSGSEWEGQTTVLCDNETESDWGESLTAACEEPLIDHDVDESDDTTFLSTCRSDAPSVPISDFLEGDASISKEIERAVSWSNCWMNVTERDLLCRILQAYSTMHTTIAFKNEMISTAEECLVSFQGNEQAAFDAFIIQGRIRW